MEGEFCNRGSEGGSSSTTQYSEAKQPSVQGDFIQDQVWLKSRKKCRTATH